MVQEEILPCWHTPPCEKADRISILSRAILATLAYHATLRLPLTSSEIWLNLIWPCVEARRKWQARGDGWNRPARDAYFKSSACLLREVEIELRSNKWLRRHLASFRGFWFLVHYGSAHQVQERMERYLITQEKWRYLLRLAPVLRAVPFVDAVAVTGSMVVNNARPQSDLDLFFLVRTGRIWTARFGATALTQLLGIRRLPAGRVTRNKLCLNHYIAWPLSAQQRLKISSLYTAYELSRLIPLWGAQLLADFREKHSAKLQRFLMHVPPLRVLSPRRAVRWRWLKKAALMTECVLQGCGEWSEHFLAQAQKSKMFRRAATVGRQDTVIASDVRLAFHPDSHAQRLWRDYVTICARMSRN